MSKRVLVAMSGGIDSSVAAYLLQKEGYEVTGLFMRNGIEHAKANQKSCCSVMDAYDASRVASQFGIKFYSANFKDGFEKIIDYFVSEYNEGRTPNPCIMCNKLLKFGKLFEYADSLGIEMVATGHYARIESNNRRFILKRASDLSKDQSYVLFSLSQKQLSRTMLPLGSMIKEDVRSIAKEAGMRIFDKPDSQEICFVPGNNYRELLMQKTPESISSGEIKSDDGKLLGTHQGHQLYTIGQRHGLGIATGKPVYVTEIDKRTNTVIVGDKESLRRQKMTVDSINWVSESYSSGQKFDATVKIRHTHKPQPASIEVQDADACQVTFHESVSSITPGQAAVFFNNEVVLGGGWIKKSVQ